MISTAGYRIDFCQWGTLRLDGGAMFGVVPKTLWEKTNPPDERNRITLAMRGLLVRAKGINLLVDVGVGDNMSDKLRSIYGIESSRKAMLAILLQFGLTEQDITHIVLTHLHFDHAAGVIDHDRSGKVVPMFPNAELIIGKVHFDHSQKPNLRDRASFLSEDIAALHAVHPFRTIDIPGEILPGIRIEFVNGHTPGQIVVTIGDENRTVFYPADLIPTSSHIRLAYHMGYDLQPLTILDEKQRFLRRAVEKRWLVAFEHDPTVVLARVAGDDGDFRVVIDETTRSYW